LTCRGPPNTSRPARTSANPLIEAHRNTGSPLADPAYLPSVAARAWRWAPEMHEIADTLTEAGLPPHLALATAEVRSRWEGDKDHRDLPLTDVLRHLTQNPAADRLRSGRRAEPYGQLSSEAARFDPPAGAGSTVADVIYQSPPRMTGPRPEIRKGQWGAGRAVRVRVA